MDEDIKKLLAENVAVTKEIRDMLTKINRYFLWAKIKSAIYLFVFVIMPLLVSYIYLPAIIGKYTSKYEQFVTPLLKMKSSDSIDFSKFGDVMKQFNTKPMQIDPKKNK